MFCLRRQKIIVSIIFLVLISGCGFHLRGFVDMPRWFNKVAIIVQQGHRDLAPLLQKQLQAYNIEVTDEPSSAPYWLIIQSDNMQENISSVSSSTTPRQYQLVYTLRFKLQKANGVEMIHSSQIIVTRQITINSDRILGSTDEEELQKSEMRRDAVIQIINRISQKAEVTSNNAH